MQAVELVLQSAATILLGGIGVYFSYNYRIQTRLKVLELRIEAYRKLFAITEPASPGRRGRGLGLSAEEARKLGDEIHKWYYDNGNGILMPNRTRQHLHWLLGALQGDPPVDSTSDALINEVSKLRTMLRQDVGVFSRHESGWYKGG
jgi:hypothetical protein